MKSILDEVKAGLAQGMEPGMIVSDELIPAINEVGDLFEQQKYFLPQLIASAETMKKAIEYLEPMLSSGDETGPKVTIVIATVEGDIHDIGKNLVALMLKNYGFRVVDLGKDVPKEDIVQAAIDEKADIIAKSFPPEDCALCGSPIRQTVWRAFSYSRKWMETILSALPH